MTRTIGASAPTSSTDQIAQREIIIAIRPGEWVRYEGTRAQLEAEGIIPEDFEWPRALIERCWRADGFDYRLRRTRPEDLKGPMRTWLEMDYWFIRIEVTGRDWEWHANRRIEEKAKALRDEIYRQSDAGQSEWHANWARYCKALNDTAFQAFKSIFVPERKKRGPKPKARIDSTSQGDRHA